MRRRGRSPEEGDRKVEEGGQGVEEGEKRFGDMRKERSGRDVYQARCVVRIGERLEVR